MAGAFLEHRPTRVRRWRRRSRFEWNITCVCMAIIALFLCSIIAYELLCEFNYYKSDNVFISYDGQILVTDSEEFAIPSDNNAYMNLLTVSLETGDKIIIKVSKLSGEVLELSSNGDIVYKLSNAAWYYIVIVVLFLGALLTIVCLSFYTVNSKNPRGVFAEIQREFIL